MSGNDISSEPPQLIWCQSRRRRSPAIKLRRSNRLFRVGRLGSELAESLSEFLASRNVIYGQNQSRYIKIAECQEATTTDHHNQLGPEHRKRPFRAFGLPGPLELAYANGNATANYHCVNENVHYRAQPIKFESNGKLSARTTATKYSLSPRKGRRVARLLGALLSGRHENRATLLVKLLRAPIVLAALFSLALIISLLVLYALSFHQHNTTSQEMLLLQLKADSDQPETSSVVSVVLHHINSRQLQQRRNATSAPSKTDDAGGWRPASSNEHQQASAPSDHHQSVADGSARPVVATECGAYEGAPEGRALAFKGIPYASPPVGPRRWTRPRPIWRDAELCQQTNRIHQAQSYKRHCVQLSPFTRRMTGDEDCLYLDIFSPELNPLKKLPVMVYIHGGFLAYGSSGQGQVNWMKARPSGELAADLNVLLVAPNYRLQALGFMALSQLAQNNGPDGSEGNYGLWDQLVALDWIRRNIESFGGDPDNIVLFGPDSASSLPLALISQDRQQQVEIGADNTFSTTNDGANQPVGGVLDLSAHLKRRPNGSQSRASDLFRAVWLTNPTVYYEQPYELANKHYQRLIESQSTCSAGRSATSMSSSVSTNGDQQRTRADEQATGAQQKSTGPVQLNETNNQSGQQMLKCLMNLKAEQVVREYLGRDDPAFRLDDQSSLPIRNIFADQFVTVDGELVQDSYPFHSLNMNDEEPANSWHNATRGSDQEQISANRVSQQATNEWAPTKTNYGADYASNTVGKPSSRTNEIEANSHASGKSLLIGSSAQAVEYWPCPRNLYQWTWEDFRRYVGTSLNSFTLETYRQASEMYQVPSEAMDTNSNNKNWASSNQSTNKDPIETYLTMVSDIRQICPINELSESLRRHHNIVHRYIVEWRPSGQLSASMSQPANSCGLEVDEMKSETNNNSGNGNGGEHKPRYAFHYWDLLAFFGFQFDPNLKPTEQDLRFQEQVRKMVKEFVWNTNGSKRSNETKENDGFTLFDLDGTRRRRDEFRRKECKMWQQFLKQSYAWIS